MSRVVVIGAGAAGLMSAYQAAALGHRVILLDKNEKAGKKIYITGKGRCNFTNTCDTEDFFKNVVSNPKFLYSAIYSFDSTSVIDFFESNGMATKIERGNRAFPLSDHASDVTNTLLRAGRSAGVELRLNTKVLDIEKNDVFTIKTDKGDLKADSVIVCTGGLSYPSTGSTGDGYKFAEKFGHSVTKLRPALVPFNCKESYVTDMQGLSLKNVSLTIKKDNKKLFEEFGEMLFTHFGISGPLVLSASSVVGDRLMKNEELKAYINLKPALDDETLDKRLVTELNGNKKLITMMGSLLPSSMIGVFLELAGLDKDKAVNLVTKEERRSIFNLLRAFPMTLTSLRGYNEAIVTKGGISVKEINPSTMESKLVKGLYFAGEVLDVDGYTGGFNLQIAFSTGYLAGVSIE